MGRRELGLIVVLAAVVAAGGACRGIDARRSDSGDAPASAADSPRSSDPFEDARRRIAEARALPIPPGNYQITVERVWFAERDSSSLGAIVGYTDDEWDVRVGEASADAGFRVGVAKGGFYGHLDGQLRTSTATSREQAMIMTVPASPAFIAVGETRYFTPFFVKGATFVLPFPDGQFVGTSLEATCRPSGDGVVEVELVPIFSSLANAGQTVRVNEARTTVRVPLERPFLIGSHDTSDDSVATALLSRRSTSGVENAVLILTVAGGE